VFEKQTQENPESRFSLFLATAIILLVENYLVTRMVCIEHKELNKF